MNISVNAINKSYGKKRVLSGIDFSAESGECIGILGCNGCGKSTLLNILSGIISCDSGEFICDGINLLKNTKRREKIISYVPQTPPLIDELSAKDNLLMWYSPEEIKSSLSSGVLKMLQIDSFLKTPVKKMSGGMKKRLSIACAVSNRPKILLLDEPSAALDPICRQVISNYVENFKEYGGIVIMATHDFAELSMCNTCYIIKDGRLVKAEDTDNMAKLVNSL